MAGLPQSSKQTKSIKLVTGDAHDRYSRLFINQRLRAVYDRIDTSGDGLQYPEVRAAFKRLGFKATKQQIHDICWEVDEVGKGEIGFDAVKYLLHRLHKAKTRCVGTGSNLFRGLLEYMMFDTDTSGKIDIEEVQQMFYVYYGFRGVDLERKVRQFQQLRKNPKKEIKFKEFQQLMDTLMFQPVTAIDPGLEAPPPLRKPAVPRVRDCRYAPRPPTAPLVVGASPRLSSPRVAWGTPRSPTTTPRGPLVNDGHMSTGRTNHEANHDGIGDAYPPLGWATSDVTVQGRTVDVRHQMSERRFKGMSSDFMTQYKAEIKAKRQKEAEILRQESDSGKMTLSSALMNKKTGSTSPKRRLKARKNKESTKNTIDVRVQFGAY